MSEEEKKSKLEWKIVGYNVLALVGYTLLFRLVDGGIIFDCIVVGLHFLVAIILALTMRKWEWFMSGLLVLIIGFSTCVTLLGSTLGNMH